MVSFIFLINLFYSVGKTSILDQYCSYKFTLQYRCTIGADFKTKNINLDENEIQLQIWDSAGTEKYSSLGQSFLRNTNCCALVFDLTILKSNNSHIKLLFLIALLLKNYLYNKKLNRLLNSKINILYKILKILYS